MKSLDKRAAVMILAGGQGSRLYPLTKSRAKPAVPFGGSYRIIDFTLSNCLNSGLTRIFLLTQYRSVTLHRHVQNCWSSYVIPALGQFIDLAPPQQKTHATWYMGTADAIYQNIEFLEQTRPEYALILSGDHVYKMDYGKMLEAHAQSGAVLTVGCIEAPIQEASRFGVMEADEHFQIRSFVEKPTDPKPMPGKPDSALASMGIYIFNTDALVKALIDDARRDSDHDFGKNIIPRLVDSQEQVNAFPFHEPNRPDRNYWRDIGTLDSFYEAHQDLLKPEPPFDLYSSEWPIRALRPPAPPARLLSDGETQLSVDNSLLSSGSLLRGAVVRDSVVAPNVTVEPGARVEGSILFEGAVVRRGAVVSRAVVDKEVVIPPNRRVSSEAPESVQEFKVTESGIAVIPKGMILS